ncbi:MAG: acyl-CoA carboxylase subunit beta [Anaerolineaceae bacterium]|nr:acyl-CoA carboxylase subunit beta [Anaerolineaceae bacterium]
MSNNKFEQYTQKLHETLQGGGPARVDRQHENGKLTARERIDLLLDSGTFHEIDNFVTHRSTQFNMDKTHTLTDGVIIGWGKIDERLVYLYAQDFTVMGGSLGEAHGRKIAKIMKLAVQNGAPLIGLNDSGGARIQEGVDSLAAFGDIFLQNTKASGVIPQITMILGPCAGGAVYSPAITDFIFMLEKKSFMFITGPDVVKAVTHEEVDFESLGGSEIHSQKSGVAHFTGSEEVHLFEQLRWLLSYLPSNNLTPPPITNCQDDPNRTNELLNDLVPENPQEPYDMLEVIQDIVDDGEFLETQPGFARNIITGFARFCGKPVGIIANQPVVLAGVLDIDASDKAARFIRFCDSFHIPLVTLVDTPVFLPGTSQEHGGIIRHGAKMIFAYAEATVPKISIILRKAYGGAYIVMSSKHLDGDLNYSWPNAEIAVMGPQGAVEIMFRKELKNTDDPIALKHEMTKDYRENLANPYIAASRGYLDAVVLPSDTRRTIIDALEGLQNKRQAVPSRKHGNIPL